MTEWHFRELFITVERYALESPLQYIEESLIHMSYVGYIMIYGVHIYVYIYDILYIGIFDDK